MGNRPHRLKGTDREGTTAVSKATAIGGEGLIKNRDHNGEIKVKSARRGLLLHRVECFDDRLLLPGPVPSIAVEMLEKLI